MNTALHTRNHRRLIHRTKRRCSAQDAGGKGWNLLRLRALGFPVPPFVILSADMFATCAAGFREEMTALLRGLRIDEPDGIARAAAELRAHIMALPLPAEIIRDIYSAFDTVVEKNGSVSVRSSVAGEDGVRHSFAGQMDTVLNVARASVTHALRRVWASAFSRRALTYRLHAGLPLLDIRIAVVLQRMLRAEASGVLFTRHPVTAVKECFVIAGYGLGEGVVSDLVETDSYRCPVSGTVVDATLARKTRAMRFEEFGRDGLRIMAVPQDMQDVSVLRDGEVLQLRDWGMRLESEFGLPVDVEWARAADGMLFLLQARPVTANGTNEAPPQVWDNANIVESYPGMTSPLTFSVIREAYTRAFRGAMRGFLLREAPLRRIEGALSSLLGHQHGRVYYNLRNWYAMLSVLPGIRRNRRAWDQMIGIAHAIDLPSVPVSILDRVGTGIKCAWRLLHIRRNARHFHEGFTRACERWSAMDIVSADAPALRRQYAMIAEEATLLWPRTLYNDFAAMTWYDLLKRCCSRKHFDEGLHNRLLCAEPGIESVQPVRALVRMAESIRADAALSRLFRRGGSDAAILETARRDPSCAVLSAFLDDYIARFGDRGFEELKLESSTYRQRPTALIGMLRGYVHSGLTCAAMEREEQRTRTAAEAELRRAVRNPFARIVTRIVLNRARAAVAARENMRFSRSRLYGLLRRIFQRYGELLANTRVINDAEDVFFLEMEEVFAAAEKRLTPAEARSIVARRRQRQESDVRMTLPSRFLRRGDSGPVLTPETGTATHAPASGIAAPGDAPDAYILRGTGCSAGTVTAPCMIVRDPRQAGDVRGRILVARSTDPGWVFLMISAAGLIVEQGSVLSHTAIIGRELGIPTIVAAKDAMQLLDGAASVTINGSTGEIRWN